MHMQLDKGVAEKALQFFQSLASPVLTISAVLVPGWAAMDTIFQCLWYDTTGSGFDPAYLANGFTSCVTSSGLCEGAWCAVLSLTNQLASRKLLLL